MENKSRPLVTIENLKKYYKEAGRQTIKAVDGINLSIMSGQTLGIVGESGCGKSTLGRQIVALEKPTQGTITYDGMNLTKMNQRSLQKIRTKIQMVFQDPHSSLNPRKNIHDILAEPMLYHKIVNRHNVDNEIKKLLTLVGIPSKAAYKYPHEFSGGQRQRIGIAKALSLKAELIVCDEPVSALDVSVQAQVLNLLKDIQAETNITYVFIGHGLGAVNYMSDRIAVMYLGKIVEEGPAYEVFANPLHPYSKALFDASPVPDPNKRDRERIVLKGEAVKKVSEGACTFYDRCPYATEACLNKEDIMTADAVETTHYATCHMGGTDRNV